MIFVTVGTHYLGFERLIKKMDEISGGIDEEVIAQIGSTKYRPKNMTYFTFVEDENEILELCKKARIIVSHAGAGSLLTILNYMKPLIVVPRLKKFNEHIDDHQLELAEVLKNDGKFVLIYDVKNLEATLKEIGKSDCNKNKKDKKLINFLKKFIETMENENLHDIIDSVSP
jgi:UDP-N-acetylglucosamine transferase subunit ALG13